MRLEIALMQWIESVYSSEVCDVGSKYFPNKNNQLDHKFERNSAIAQMEFTLGNCLSIGAVA
jgi:hypothetical protein